jgi:hypothetical protein
MAFNISMAGGKFPVGQVVKLFTTTDPSRPPETNVAPTLYPWVTDTGLTATVDVAGQLAFTGLAELTDYIVGAQVGGVWQYRAIGRHSLTASGGAASVGAYQLTDIARQAWRPTGAIAENVPRMTASTNLALVPGTLDLYGGLVIPQGKTVNSISFVSGGTAAGTPTNQWFCLIDALTLAILGKTADDGATAWGLNTLKTLALSAPYTALADIAVYLGIMVAATTAPSIAGTTATGNNMGAITPRMSQHANAGLTNPASLVTVTPGTQLNTVGYGYVS